MSTAEKMLLRGYRSVGDVSFDLDGTLSTCIGWVLFEVGDTQLEHVRGVISTFNNYATLTILRLAHDQEPCRIHGWFDNGQTDTSEWTLDSVARRKQLKTDRHRYSTIRRGPAGTLSQS